MTTRRASLALAPVTLWAGVFALSGTMAGPIANASPLDGIRSAVVAARSGSPCAALTYNIDLEGNAQALVGNNLPGVPPSGRYNGKTAENSFGADPTSAATGTLVGIMRPLINNCAYKDFGVGMARRGDTSYVSLTLGEPAAPPPAPAPAPAPVVEAKPIRCTGGLVIPAGQTCPPAPPPVEKAPTNAVTLNIVREGLRAKVTVGNTSNLQAQCTYNAKEVNGLGLPVSRDFGINPKGTTPLEFAAPLIGQTYTVVVACRADFNGQNVEIGRVQQDFSSF